MLNAKDELDDHRVEESPPLQRASSGDSPIIIRRASDRTPIGRIVGPIEYTFSHGDYDRALELIEQQPIVAWYGIEPHRFTHIVKTLAQEAEAPSPLVRIMSLVTDPASMSEPLPENELGFLGQVFALRLQGRPVEAMKLAGQLDETSSAPLLPLIDPSQGMGLFMALQTGITAMLAGDFQGALSKFIQARMNTRLPAFDFLMRDACLKGAMLEALYGDHDRARTLMDMSREFPRTESWAEPLIDVSEAIAKAMLHADQSMSADASEEAMAILDAVSLHDVGEMWPFYVAATQRILLLDGRSAEAKHRLDMFEQIPVPRLDGQGYSGSVISLMGALRSLIAGDLQDARERLALADDSIVATQVYAAMLDLASGRAREALRCTADLREHTQGLRLFDFWRSIVSAASHLALGAPDECCEVLDGLRRRPGGVTRAEAGYLPEDLRRLAEAELPDWPRYDGLERSGFDFLSQQGALLTSREQEILAELTDGATREEIANRQFISMNTLKAHLRSIYRKLEVGTREAAVLEAERRGLL